MSNHDLNITPKPNPNTVVSGDTLDAVSNKPMLFLLEDDSHLQSEIQEFAIAEQWEVRSARCVEEGIEEFAKLGNRVRLAIVDITLPFSTDNLRTLREGEARKEAYVKDHFPDISTIAKMDADALADVRMELSDYDKSIRDVVDFDGGIRFLDHLSDANYDCSVVVFSARCELKDCAPIEILVKQKRWIGWFPKPIDPANLAKLLSQSHGNLT